MGAVGLRIEILNGLTHLEPGTNGAIQPDWSMTRLIAACRRYRSKAEALLSAARVAEKSIEMRPEKQLRLGFLRRFNTCFVIRNVFSQIGQLAIKE